MKKIAVVILILLAGCAAKEAVAPSRTATVRIVAGDTAQAVDAVTRSVQALGGHVAASEVWREGDLLRARLTLHVPRASLEPTLAAIRSAADRVERETVSNEDLGHHCVDE